MLPSLFNRPLRTVLGLLALCGTLSATQASAPEGRISVAVTVSTLEPIVRAVSGGQADCVVLFKGCILRPDLRVEPGARARLTTAEAIVWSGFLKESAALHGDLPGQGKVQPRWIDVSREAFRTNLPTSTCFGSVDPAFASGDPFFWLNPENGGVIARNIAIGLGELRPKARAQFLANAEQFRKAMEQDIARWKVALKPLHHLRVFSLQCGWQNAQTLGGPRFLVCKGTPGELPSPGTLLDNIRKLKADVILVDPSTPHEYVDHLRAHAGIRIVEVPSMVEDLPGATTYSALFDHLVKALHPLARP